MKHFENSLCGAMCGALVVLTLLRPSPARAQTAYDAVDGCPSQGEFEQRLSKHSMSMQDAHISIRVTESGFVGDVSRGSNVVRRVEGRTCDAVVDALVLAITLGAVGAEDASPGDPSATPSGGASMPDRRAGASETSSDGRTTKAVRDEKRTANAPLASDDREKRSREDRKSSKRFSLELNPLSVLIGRYGLTGEFLLMSEHALVVTPYVVHTGVDASELPVGLFYNADSALTAFGGEIGYRYYPRAGFSGPYVGVSALVGYYVWNGVDWGGARSEIATMSVGGAVDVGGQVVVGPGILLGGGLGVQYTTAAEKAVPITKFDSPLAASAIRGVSPRFLLTVGYAF